MTPLLVLSIPLFTLLLINNLPLFIAMLALGTFCLAMVLSPVS